MWSWSRSDRHSPPAQGHRSPPLIRVEDSGQVGKDVEGDRREEGEGEGRGGEGEHKDNMTSHSAQTDLKTDKNRQQVFSSQVSSSCSTRQQT